MGGKSKIMTMWDFSIYENLPLVNNYTANSCCFFTLHLHFSMKSLKPASTFKSCKLRQPLFFADSNNFSWSWGSLHSQDLLIYKLYFTTSLSLINCETSNLCHISRYIPLRERMTPLPGKRNQQIIAQLGLTKTIHQKRQNVLCMKQKLLEEWLWKLLWKRCNFYIIHFKQFF